MPAVCEQLVSDAAATTAIELDATELSALIQCVETAPIKGRHAPVFAAILRKLGSAHDIVSVQAQIQDLMPGAKVTGLHLHQQDEAPDRAEAAS